MNQYQQEYVNRKKRILELIKNTIQYMKEIEKAESASEEEKKEAAGHAEALSELKKNVENQLFSIVLIGEFSAGKSSFLNAMMRQKILPTWSGETTATVNFLRDKDRAPNGEAGIVYYQDGTTKTLQNLDSETLEKYVSTRGEEGTGDGTKLVERVDLFLDNKFLKDGVMLVDSPGLNGVTKGLAAITEKQMEQSHASIFMFSADHSGSRSDFQYLNELKEKCPRIFILFNKIDKIDPSENETPEDMVQDLKDKYHEFYPDEELPEIYPISAQLALCARDPEYPDMKSGETPESLEKESRFGIFEDRLWRYLTQGERTKDQMLQPVKKIAKQLTSERTANDNLIEMLKKTTGPVEINEKKEKLEDAIHELEGKKYDQAKTLNSSIHKSMDDLKYQLTDRLNKMGKGLIDGADDYESPDDVYAYAKELPDQLKRKMSGLVIEFDDILRDKMIEIAEAYCTDQLAEAYSSLKQIPGLAFQMEVPDISISEAIICKNYEKMNQEIDALENEYKCLCEKKEETELMSAKARKIEQQIEDLNDEIKQKRRELSNYDINFIPRDVQTTLETRTVLRDRRGSLGKIAQWLLGKKEDNETVTVKDSTAHDEDVRTKEEKIKEMKAGINEDENKRNAIIGTDYTDSDTLSVRVGQIDRKLRWYEESLQKYRDDANKQLQKEAEKANKKLRRGIEEYVEDTIRIGGKAIKDCLEDQKVNYESAVYTLATATIQNELEEKRNRLNNLIKAMEASDKERFQKLQWAEGRRDKLINLLSEAAAIHSELDLIKPDTIENKK